MQRDFWLERWRTGEIGFHASEPNAFLVEHFSRLSLAPGSRVLVPLCGKTLDIGWLLAAGFNVVGIELSRQAVEELFAELKLTPAREQHGDITHFSAERIDIYQGDIFEVSAEMLGVVDAVYDRAALVALPPAMRERYVAHLLALSRSAPQLLVTFEYDQEQMPGPPFSVPDPEVVRHYAASHDLRQAAKSPVAGGLKGQCAADEAVWLLQRGRQGQGLLNGSEFHASLRVTDLTRAVHFYAWLLETWPKDWTRRYATFIRPDLNLNFVVVVADGKTLHHDTLYHLGIGVADRETVVRAYHAAVEHGVHVEKPPRTTWRGTPLHELWLKDPDGNLIEIYARLTAEELVEKPDDLEPTFLVPWPA